MRGLESYPPPILHPPDVRVWLSAAHARSRNSFAHGVVVARSLLPYLTQARPLRSDRTTDRPLFFSFSPTNDGRFAGGAFLFCPHPHVRCRPTAERRRWHEGGRTAPDRSFQGGGGQAVEARHRSFRLRLRRLALQLARGSRSFRAVPCGGVSVGQRLVDMVQILFRYSSDMVQIWLRYVCGSAARSVVS